ncbi:hypothetical protein BU25DRAFT_453750 [Macroventuria anomochaeta]|uniref:Uncharacterized protein n=1 Tax=Macroventuria anomochaeta TaxID=301207 RepID=A0ACB6SGU1_9PLEO|nr:uncharacterized protein BU25DRAFT_453750 [Macroventuria anomochaeta]KAF2632534.1 hypothetical protein BU25DRAFT_453750 [Macroventuria anomochaeta]
MSQLLQPLSIFDFTPPSSPTRLSDTMKWLKRTPTSVPLPPSPTKSREGSDDDSRSTSSTESLTLTESNFAKVIRSLQRKSSTLTLQQKASSLSLSTTPVGTPQREAARWLFGPSPVHAVTSGPPVDELSDHFVRSLPTYQEKQAELCRRQEASRERVKRMRAHLGAQGFRPTPALINEINDPFTAIEGTEPSGKHQRYDSGSHEHSDSGALQKLQKLHTTTTSEPTQEESHKLPLLNEDFLYHAMMRIWSHNMRFFNCVGCNKTHTDPCHQGVAVIWLLHGCRHKVHAACFGTFRDIEAYGFPGDTNSCYNCESLKRTMRSHTQEELDMRHKRLLKATSTDY